MINNNPIAKVDTAKTNEDTTVIIKALANDTDADKDKLSISEATATNGTVVINKDGTIKYTPNANYYGMDTISYKVSDGKGGEATSSVSVTVNSINDKPILTKDSVSTDEDTPLVISPLLNDSDSDGDKLSITKVVATNGTVVINKDATISYTPKANFNGVDTITYTVSDGKGGIVSSTITVTVNSINDNPIAKDDVAKVDEDKSVVVKVLANDTDADKDKLSISEATATNGTVIINKDGTIKYTPNKDYNGVDTISYKVSDGKGGTDTATVSVAVKAVNDAPTKISLNTNTVYENSEGAIIGKIAVTDVDDMSFTYTVSDKRFEIVNGNLKLKDGISLNYEVVGSTIPVKVTVKDSANSVYTETFKITVSEAPTLALTTDSGSLATDKITNVADLTFSTLESGAIRTYKIDGADATSSYIAPTIDGAYSVIVTDTYLPGNSSNATYSFTLDKTLPTVPTITLTTDSGSLATDKITNVANLTFSTLESGANRTYKVDGADATSSYIAPTTDGEHTVIVTDTDIAGNVVSSNYVFTLDKTLPTVPNIQIKNTITSHNDLFEGHEENAYFEYSLDQKTWFVSFIPNQWLNTIFVRQIDLAGNNSNATESFTFIFDKKTLMTTTFETMSSEQAQFIGSKGGFDNFTAEQILSVAHVAFPYIPVTVIVNLTAVQINSLTINQISTLTSEQVQALSNANKLDALDANHVVALSNYINYIPVTVIVNLTAVQINSLAINQISTLTSEQVQALSNANKLDALDANHVVALSNYINYIPVTVIVNLTAVQINSLAINQISTLTSEQVQALSNANKLDALDANHVVALSNYINV